MTLIKSISGIRGTIGGVRGENLTPPDIVNFVSAYADNIVSAGQIKRVVVGRDGRISGRQVEMLTVHTLIMMGFEVINLGLSTTPTVEMAVQHTGSSGGIIITASHNPGEWNALKFLNGQGEFISAQTGRTILAKSEDGSISFASASQLGSERTYDQAIQKHIEAILDLPEVDVPKIRKSAFHIGVDCINSTGALAIPPLLDALGCSYFLINESISGQFAHNPEPLEQHLGELSKSVIKHRADLGIAVDPDVDRLAFVDERGRYCGEEYTLVMVAAWVLANKGGNTVSNLSSTRALRDITESRGFAHYAAAVGEVNVVEKMKEVGAVIGGEGNGGVIFPDLHYGRDALAGIALLLSALSDSGTSLSDYRGTFPEYIMSKNKIDLSESIDVDALLDTMAESYKAYETDRTDGLKIYIRNGWVHLRKSNTEPIIRLYAEEKTEMDMNLLMAEINQAVQRIIGA